LFKLIEQSNLSAGFVPATTLSKYEFLAKPVTHFREKVLAMVHSAREKLYHQFPALQYRNYRLYFYGQLVSFTGSWLHGVAYGWLIFQLTHSAFWLGVDAALGSIPVLLLSLIGGSLVDRYNRKKILLITQSSSFVVALTLGILTVTHLISLPMILALTFLSGISNAIDNPASNAFVVDIVAKENLPSAIGLNSTMFNTGRVLGPATAGFLIALVGVGNIFFINALSFLAIIVSLLKIKSQAKTVDKPQENQLSAIKEGIKYAASHPKINRLLLTAAMGAIFCFSQATIMPIFATKVFSGGTQALGILLSATGIGALCGSLFVSSYSHRVKPSLVMLYGCGMFILGSLAFSFTKNVMLASSFLFFSGLGMTAQFSTMYATIQRHVKEEFRGRVSSIYVLLFIGLGPVGNIFIGTTATIFGVQMAVRLGSLIMLSYGVVLFLNIYKLTLPTLYQKSRHYLAPVFSLREPSHRTSLQYEKETVIFERRK
jgi:MFS family permease